MDIGDVSAHDSEELKHVSGHDNRSRALKAQILNFDRQIMAWHRSSEPSKRLDQIPGVGPALATALVASLWR